MIALLQRVSQASVSIDAEVIARIGPGLLVLLGVEREDDGAAAARMAERILHYRLFADVAGRMNLSVLEAGGEVLVVPQFTLAADTGRGRRPGFTRGAPPALASSLFNAVCEQLDARHRPAGRGVFGADMQVALINDGPVTFWLQG